MADYKRAFAHSIHTVRDGVRWHLIECEPYAYDFSSLEWQIEAANESGIEVIWDYFHYGFPDDIDIFSDEFVNRFVQFSVATTHYLTQALNCPIYVCPMNEISFFSWIAANRGHFYPALRGRDNQLKQQLIRASIEAVRAIRDANPSVTIMFTEPAIHVVPRDESATARRAAESYRRSQFHALDRLEAAATSQLPMNDVIGLNYYFHNQWRHPSRRKIARGHRLYRPFHQILSEFYERYRLPILIAETGIEDDHRADWFRYVCDEVAIAMRSGIPIEGICLYPIVNHPGWADDRHCHNGLWDFPDENGDRDIYLPLSEEIRNQLARFHEILKEQDIAKAAI